MCLLFADQITSDIQVGTSYIKGKLPPLHTHTHTHTTRTVIHTHTHTLTNITTILTLLLTLNIDVHPPGVQPGDIRLFGDVRNGYGAVQVYTSLHGWQGICPDSTWSSGYPSAICRDLGYRSGSVADPVFADVVPGGESPSRLLYEMSCPSGSDSVEECSFMLGGDDTSNCNSPVGLYAAVECGEFNIDVI